MLAGSLRKRSVRDGERPFSADPADRDRFSGAPHISGMREQIVNGGVELAAFVLYAVASLVIGAIGLVVEYHSLLYALAGDYPLAAWVGVVGAVVLFFGYLTVRDKLIVAAEQASLIGN